MKNYNMLKYVIAFLCLVIFLIPIYIPDIRSFYLKNETVTGSFVSNCSPNHQLCTEFKVTSCYACFIPDLTAHVFVYRRENRKEFVRLSNINIGTADHAVRPTLLVWKDDHQLDIYPEGEHGSDIISYMFKNLDNLQIHIHY